MQTAAVAAAAAARVGGPETGEAEARIPPLYCSWECSLRWEMQGLCLSG